MAQTRSAANLLLALALTLPAHADTLNGRVTAIQDGDTLTVLDDQRQEHRIRLAAIDAPEKRQPWGEQSRANLARLVFGQAVTVEWQKRDRYQRIVGEVFDQTGADAGLAQLHAGLAWHYLRYAPGQSPSARAAYTSAEAAARATRAGLWTDAAPMPPWEWRHAH